MTPVHNKVGSRDSQTAVGLPGAKPYHTFVWVDDIAQVIQNPTFAPDVKKVQVRPEALWRHYSGAPETGNSQVSKTVFRKYGLDSFNTAPV